MGRPHAEVITDGRPDAPEKPTSAQAIGTRKMINALVTNNRLAWASREKLCPEFDATFTALKNDCDMDESADTAEMEKCVPSFAMFYPCFSYFLRPSTKYSHGIDGFIEVSTIYHLIREAPWNIIKAVASEKPWDEEFEVAMEMFGY